MFTVADVEEDVKRVLGGADDATFYSRLNHAVEILATESEWDPLLGYVDVCVGCDRFITLPRDVGTVLSVNIDGTPSQGHDFFWKFHLNGPGNKFTSVGWHWYNGLPVCTSVDPASTGASLVTILETAEDTNKKVRVYGYDVNGTWIRSLEDGIYVDGFLVPTSYGTSTPNPSAPLIRNITRVSKDVTAGTITLGFLNDDTTITPVAKYMPNDTEPKYRRIQVSRPCSWARVAFRRDVLKLTNPQDLIPLHSRYAVVLMVKALRKFDEDRMDEGMSYKRGAVNLLIKKQESLDVPGGPSVQIADGNLLMNKQDRLE